MSLAYAQTKAAVRRQRKVAGPRLRLVPPVDDPAVEAAEVKDGIAETIALERGRGAVFVGRSPHFRLDPLGLLFRDGLITRTEAQAGERYGNQYKLLYDRKRISGQWRTYLDDTTTTALKINRIRQEAFHNAVDMIFICDQICGRDVRPSHLFGVDHQGAVVKRLREALFGLAKFYRLIWWEDEQPRDVDTGRRCSADGDVWVWHLATRHR